MNTFSTTLDRLISKAGPVNSLIDALSERLLPTATAHASGYYVDICSDIPCGRGKVYNGRYTCMHIVNTNENINCVYAGCDC